MLSRLRSSDWRRWAAELLLIFAGVYSALWLENENRERLERQRESALIDEIVFALELDLSDLRANLVEDSLTLNSIRTVLGAIQSGTPYSSSLDTHFAQAAGLTVFVPHLAAYENLKVTGFDLLSSPELRRELVAYYEHRLQVVRRMEELFVNPLWADHLNRLMLERFDYTQRKIAAAPRDPALILGDREYASVLRHMEWALGMKGGQYRRAVAAADSLLLRLRRDGG